MPRRKRETLKTPKNTSLPIDQDGVQGVTPDNILKALASLPTYRFNGSCGPYKMDDASTFERWCVQTGRDVETVFSQGDDCEAERIYDGSRDAFNDLLVRYGVDRAYAIVDAVAGFVDAFDRATPDFQTILQEVIAYHQEGNNDL